ncbi:MAG: carbohydrate-binding protein [Acidothermaceae bacterium]
MKSFKSRTAIAVAATTALPISMLLGISGTARAATGFPAHYAAPYLQLSNGTVGDMNADMNATGTKYYTLALIIPSSGCTGKWEDGDASVGSFTSQINSLKSAGGNVIISFGGASGGELAQTCTSVSSLEAAYANIVNTYGVTRLDFDIEGGVIGDTASTSRRDQALAALQAANPSVQVDFTLAVDPNGMESPQLNLLNDAKSKGVKVNCVNIMTMDFGGGTNDLSAAESAARGSVSQLEGIFGISATQAWNMLGLTPIAGTNDDGTFFSQSDASSLESFAASNGVQELAFWEVDGYDKGTGYAYSRIFNQITSGSTGGGGNTSAFSTIQAEAYSSQSGTQTEATTDTGGGADVGHIANGDWLAYNSIDFGSGGNAVTARLASGASISGNVEVHLDSLSNPTIATIAMSPTGGWQAWVSKTASMSTVTGVHTVYLRFASGSSGDFANINWFTFGAGGGGSGVISLRAHANGDYVTADNAGASPLIANKTAIGTWEEFDLINNADGSISLRAHANSDYVTAENAGASALIANRTAIAGWEEFDLIDD